jgi:hypothetical protein
VITKSAMALRISAPRDGERLSVPDDDVGEVRGVIDVRVGDPPFVQI